MSEIDDTTPHAVVLSHGDDSVTEAVAQVLRADGWTVDVQHGDTQSAATVCSTPVAGVVYIPGLLTGDRCTRDDPARVLVDLVDTLLPHLRPLTHGGARVVTVGSRDWLGWPGRPHRAAQAAGLNAAVRSLALQHGRAGVTVNAVIGMPTDAAERRATGPVPGTHLYEPIPLDGEPVTAHDIAATVAFFLAPDSGYLTGQVLHCCGGASLLSSLSV